MPPGYFKCHLSMLQDQQCYCYLDSYDIVTLTLNHPWVLFFYFPPSLHILQDICQTDVDDKRWLSKLEATHWLDYIQVKNVSTPLLHPHTLLPSQHHMCFQLVKSCIVQEQVQQVQWPPDQCLANTPAQKCCIWVVQFLLQDYTALRPKAAVLQKIYCESLPLDHE